MTCSSQFSLTFRMQASESPRRRTRIIGAWQCIFLLAIGATPQVSCQCVIHIGIDANTWGDSATESLYNFTFERYLNEQLSATTLCTFQMVLFNNIDAFVAAGLNRSIDIYFAGPGVFVCLQSRLGLVPLVSLINKYQEQPLYSLAGSAVALANRSDLQTLQDIRNQRVAAVLQITMSGISTLASGQAQWRELHTQGYNPFILASQVIFIADQQSQVMAVVNGTADVAFVRSDQPAKLAASNIISPSQLKVLSPMHFASYPWDTSTRLYPEYSLAADPESVPLEVREAIVEALFDINETHYAAKAGSYYGWSTPYNYLDAYQMQLDTNVLVNGSCLASNDTYDMVVCPANTYKLAQSAIAGLCNARGLPCPTGAKCYCNFCKPIPHKQFGNLGLAGFLSVLIIGVAILAIILFVIVRANKLTVMHIPFAELHVNDESEVLGEGVYGKVLRGEYRGTQIAVKRMLLPRTSRTKSIFDVEIIRPSRQSQEEVLSMRDSQRLINDLVIDVMADSAAAPVSSGKSVIYTAGQQFLLAPGMGPDAHKPLHSIQSVGSESPALKTSQSMGSDIAAQEKDQDESLLGSTVPTSENLLQLQQHQSAAEEELIGAYPAESPRSTFWGEESRLDMEYDESKRQFERAQYQQAHSWQDAWHNFTHSLGRAWASLGACFLCGPIKNHLVKEAVLQQTVVALRLRHPNIVTVMGTSVDPPTRALLLVTALLERGTLYDLLHNDTVMLDNDMILSMLRNVVAGLGFLHGAEPPIIHQELRSIKILLDCSCRAHLSDFQQDVIDMDRLRQRCYPFWVAPEVLHGQAPSTSSDVYALGVLIYEMLYRREPFNGEDPDVVMAALEQEGSGQGPAKRPQVPGLIDAGLVPLQTLMHHCWHQDHTLRPSLKDIDEELAHMVAEQSAVNETMAEKRQKDQALLEQMLPPQVAAALREGRAVEPESYDCVTIFFSDIVGFTNISGILQPQEVMDMLDRLYRLFDELTGKYSLFKVETIGDAYMTVGNLRTPQQDHAALVARFAIEAVQAANSVIIRSDDSTSGFLSIRAGIHSGPVVASVVGNMNPRYCLFGDTVNVASRMESSSLQNRIQLSKATAQLLVRQAPDLRRCVTRRSGQQAIKGKGFMRTYWLHTKPVDDDAMSLGTMASGSRCASQLGVHRSSSVASSGLSNANRANSDSSDKLNDAALALKEMQGSSASYTERSRINRARSAGIVPEFATVQEESAGENSDADVCRSLNADSIDPSSYSSQDLAGTVEAGTMLPDRKVAELKQSVRSDRSIVSKGGGRTTAHVGFAN